MQSKQAHTIIIDGESLPSKEALCFELAITLMYNNQKTALLLKQDSHMHKTIKNRRTHSQNLPTPTIICYEEYFNQLTNFDAIIIPEISTNDIIANNAYTYITLLPSDSKIIKSFNKNKTYINEIWELKKKIASTHKRSLNWVICENNIKSKITDSPSQELTKISRMYGFRATPPLNHLKSSFNNISGISPQDKTNPLLSNTLSYEDICAKREIINLAEFIFNQ